MAKMEHVKTFLKGQLTLKRNKYAPLCSMILLTGDVRGNIYIAFVKAECVDQMLQRVYMQSFLKPKVYFALEPECSPSFWCAVYL